MVLIVATKIAKHAVQKEIFRYPGLVYTDRLRGENVKLEIPPDLIGLPIIIGCSGVRPGIDQVLAKAATTGMKPKLTLENNPVDK